jgi:hypothetical protein
MLSRSSSRALKKALVWSVVCLVLSWTLGPLLMTSGVQVRADQQISQRAELSEVGSIRVGRARVPLSLMFGQDGWVA